MSLKRKGTKNDTVHLEIQVFTFCVIALFLRTFAPPNHPFLIIVPYVKWQTAPGMNIKGPFEREKTF